MSRQGKKLEDFPKLKVWFDKIRNRPAVMRGVEIGKDRSAQTMSEQAKKVLFGQTAASVRAR